MTNTLNKIVVIIVVLMIVGLPMGWILLSNEPPGPYFVTDSDKIKSSLKAAGFTLCSMTEYKWIVTGALGGESMVVSDDCSAGITPQTIKIYTQHFDSVQDRNNAVSLIQKSINQKDVNGGVYTFGSYLIAVQGQTGGEPITETLAQVKAAFKNNP